METNSLTSEYRLRPATATDAVRIRQIISRVHINPTALDWHRFILAVDQAGYVIACGQVKPHAGGLQELASLAVLPAWRMKIHLAKKVGVNYMMLHFRVLKSLWWKKQITYLCAAWVE